MVDPPKARSRVHPNQLPPRQSGDRLTRSEFEQCYAAMPLKKAELAEDYVSLAANESGVICSQIFPGLWLDGAAMLRGDMQDVLAVLQQGLASDEHPDFVHTLTSQKEHSSR
ncbi:hypothetical protein [Vacuolonema iberomarrocanum]|uniref:hypothetical protein n=1 Tax=Vacuolonema iberomarrocanum TaxID=3454632 RepID=UPI0019F82E7A|nr:hypothetical protein [filamentous cyanobacterium LEGE 07170]